VTGEDNGSARQAVAKLVAELGRARRAIARGDLAEAREALAAVRTLDPGNLQAQALEEQCRRAGAAPARSSAPASAGLMEQAAWLSFEQRVRERRARRCEQTADAALAAGSMADALAAIDELAVVLPSHPRIVELRKRAASPAHVEPASDLVAGHGVLAPATLPELPLQDAWAGATASAEQDFARRHAAAMPPTHTASSRRGFVALLGVLAVLCVVFAGGSWWWVSQQQASAPEASRLETPQGTPQASFEEQAIMPSPAETEPAPTEPTLSDDPANRVSVEPDASADETTPAPDTSVESASRTSVADRDPTTDASVPAAVTARSANAPPQTEPAAERPPAPLATVAAAPVGTVGNSTTTAALLSPAGAIQPVNESLPQRLPPPSPPAAVAANTSPTAIDPTAHLVAGVRQVLDRYAQGYSSKQAAIVRQVWPEVDARALERAFGQLASQDVQFDDCRIEAAETAASATCTGMASWVPAVGDRSPRRQPRTWRFALARQGQAWIITQARVAAK
jgi:hypothetical protein